ncbi:MAG: hypothetical protein IJ493_09170 [Clostridia bacterium]|nr:hypothetical protein [Clostridia bacterium]
MKKFASLLLASAMLLTALSLPAAAKDNRLNAAYGSAKVDGVMDAAYEKSQAYEVKYCKDASYSTANIYYLWDESALYVFADVTDDTLPTNAKTDVLADIWKTDCIEIGINLTPEAGETGDPHKIADCGICLAAPMYGSQIDVYSLLADNAAVKAGNVCVTKMTDKGWTVELKLPVFGDNTGVVPTAGQEIGIYSLMHNDTNDDNVRDTITRHNEDFTAANYDVTKMDYIVLQEKPAAVTENAPQTADSLALALLGMAGALTIGCTLSKKRR